MSDEIYAIIEIHHDYELLTSTREQRPNHLSTIEGQINHVTHNKVVVVVKFHLDVIRKIILTIQFTLFYTLEDDTFACFNSETIFLYPT